MAQPHGGLNDIAWLRGPTRKAIAAAGLFGVSLLTGAGVGWLNASGSAASAPTPPPISSPTSTSPDPAPSELLPSPSDFPSPSDSPSTSDSPSPAPEPSPTPTAPTKAELEQQAYSRLEKQAAADLDRTTFQRQWAAQLSSKYVGVRDPRQRTASGSRTFKAVDIWVEHSELRQKFESSYDVRLLRGEDFGTHTTHDGDQFWYTLIIDDFDSRAEVERFCASSFPRLSGEDLKNQCLPRTLKP